MCASLLDLSSSDGARAAARRLVGFGAVAAVPAAAAGASDWSDTHGAEQRVGLAHATGNAIATTLQLGSWAARRRNLNSVGAALSLTALGVTVAAAYVGGHLTLARGVGVNRTAFEEPASKWSDVAATSDLTDGKPLRVVAEGVPVVLVRKDGVVRALSAVCTHAGGPLDQGTLDDHGCIKCPWHGSEFRLADGAVARGPATVAEPAWTTKSEGGRISVRFGAG